MSDHDPTAQQGAENAGPLSRFLTDTDLDMELEFAKPKAKLSSWQLMIGSVVLMSAGAIYGMRMYGMNKGIDFTGTELSVPKIGSDADRASFEVVLARLDRSDQPVQVPIDRIGKDPFSLGELAGTRPAVARNDDADRRRQMEEAERRFEQRKREIEGALTRVSIQSLMGGRNPVASINGKLVSKGDTVEDILTVQRITSTSVIFEVDGLLFEIGVGKKFGEDEG